MVVIKKIQGRRKFSFWVQRGSRNQDLEQIELHKGKYGIKGWVPVPVMYWYDPCLPPWIHVLSTFFNFSLACSNVVIIITDYL